MNCHLIIIPIFGHLTDGHNFTSELYKALHYIRLHIRGGNLDAAKIIVFLTIYINDPSSGIKLKYCGLMLIMLC